MAAGPEGEKSCPCPALASGPFGGLVTSLWADGAPQSPFCLEDIANVFPWHSPSQLTPVQLRGHCSPWHRQPFTPLR